MPTKSQKHLNTTEPEIGGARTVGSDANNDQSGSGNAASAAELALALEASQKHIRELELKLERSEASQASGDSIDKLVNALATLIPKQPAEQVLANPENINRTTDFQNQRATVDGRSLMEAQMTLLEFRDEEKRPISIPKATAAFVGANLDVTLNGVRVSIPCDGKTYYINKSHWEHARERLAKLDLLNSNTTPQIVVMGD